MKNNQSKLEYQFRITLDTDFEGRGRRKPYREIAILESQTLSTLARAAVSSFGFDFDHCYGFYDNFKDPYDSSEIYELFTDIGEEPTEGALGVTHVKIPQAFGEVGKRLSFLFDYGDNWWFTVELTDIKPSAKDTKYPKLLKSVGKAPEQYPAVDGE